MPVFNPMVYAAKQEKSSWTPAMQAKEDAATTLQNALRARQARKTVASLSLPGFSDKVFKLKIKLKQDILDSKKALSQAKTREYDEYEIKALNLIINFATISVKVLEKKKITKKFNLANYDMNLKDVFNYVIGDMSYTKMNELNEKLKNPEGWFSSLKD
jgi:hypothetical protein